jgi:uncharacterized protein YjbI with pentapeptide repeats
MSPSPNKALQRTASGGEGSCSNTRLPFPGTVAEFGSLVGSLGRLVKARYRFRLGAQIVTAFSRTIFAILYVIVVAATASTCAAKPTREQVVAFAERCKSEKKRVDLVAEFGVDFSGLDLSRVDFRGTHAVGFETILRNANFSNCNLQHAEFGGAILDGVDFTGADLKEAAFVTASLKQATFLRVNLKATRFYQSDLSLAKLTGADLSSADITGSDFGGADLSGAILSGCRNEYWWSDFSNANLARANLTGVRLNGARFQGAVLRSAALSSAHLTQADFTAADLTDASFNDARVESAVFRNARGLAEAESVRLEGQAQRWKFELETGVIGFLSIMYFPAYALVILAVLSLSRRVLRMPDKPRSVTVAVVVNVLTFLPAFALFGMGLLGASSTVQFNTGSSGAMQLWSGWVGLWPLFMLLLLSCLVVAVVSALAFVASRWRWTVLKRAKLAMGYLILTVAHCLFATHWVGRNFPSA